MSTNEIASVAELSRILIGVSVLSVLAWIVERRRRKGRGGRSGSREF
jgi:hypothetical protein